MTTPEDIFRTVTTTLAQVPWPMTTPDDFDALAELVTKALIDEREACARIVETATEQGGNDTHLSHAGPDIAAVIRKGGAAQDEADAGRAWEPIATAPRDGTVIEITALEDDGTPFEIWPCQWSHIKRNEMFAPGQTGMWMLPDGSATWREGDGGPTHWRHINSA